MLKEQPPPGELPEEPELLDKEEAPEEEKVKLYDGPIEKFKGKPLEEFEKAYQNIESEYDKTISEKKQLEEENQAYKNWYQQMQAQQAQAQAQAQAYRQPQQYQGESGQGVDFYDKPTESFQQLYQQFRSKEFVAEEIRDAQRNAPLYEHMATTKYPSAFEGVDMNQVRQVMIGGLGVGKVHPDVVRDPEMWANTAWTLKGRQAGYQFQQAPPNPPPPMQGEMPSATRREDSTPDVTLSQEFKDLADIFLDGDKKKAQQIAEEVARDEFERSER
jgi:hypothetical protein